MTGKKITYLFGAGASYNAVPILNELSGKFRLVANKLNAEVSESRNRNEAPYKPEVKLAIQGFSNDLVHLAWMSEQYGTIDTYAKKLEINEEVIELKKLKFLVSIFFSVWQGYFHKDELVANGNAVENKYSDIDSRYKSLISNYLIKTSGSQPRLDNNVNFVSWNYDHQLESAFALFFKYRLNLTELNELIKFLPDNKSKYHENRILHLNGISNFWITHTNALDRIFQNDDELSIEGIVQRISELYRPDNFNKCTSLINYAWDNNSSKLEEAKRIFRQTDILIIVGYSFPTFNRSIDSEHLAGAGIKYEQIIYQDPNASEEVLDLFNIKFFQNRSKKENFKILKEVDQFYIPPEYFPQGEKQAKYHV